jgi:hypothetical protein
MQHAARETIRRFDPTRARNNGNEVEDMDDGIEFIFSWLDAPVDRGKGSTPAEALTLMGLGPWAIREFRYWERVAKAQATTGNEAEQTRKDQGKEANERSARG